MSAIYKGFPNNTKAASFFQMVRQQGHGARMIERLDREAERVPKQIWESGAKCVVEII